MREKALHFLFFCFHHPIRFTSWVFFKIVLKLKAFNRSKLPKPPYIVCSNHLSHLDGILISTYISHKIRWLLTKKHYQNKKMKWAYDAMRLIPVDISGSDRQALKNALAALRNKEVLGVFPEGRRSETGRIRDDVHPGAAYLSIKSGAPVLPAAVKGSLEALSPGARKLKRCPVSVGFGKIIKPPGKVTKENVNKLQDEIMDSIVRIWKMLPDR